MNTDQIIDELNTGLAPANVALDTHHRKAYISHHASSEIAVVNLDDQSIVKKIKTPFPTHAIGIDDNEEIVYATYLPETPITQPASANQVVIINALSDEVMDVLEIDANPYGIIIDSGNMKGYATVLRAGQVVAAYLETGAIERVEQEIRATADSEVTTPESDSAQSEKTSGCLIATAAYALAAWLLVVVAVPVALALSGGWAVVADGVGGFVEVVGRPRAIVLALLGFAGLLASTWKQLVQSLCIGLTGRAWVVRTSVLVRLSLLVIAWPILDWVTDNGKLALARLWDGWPWILATLAGLKLAAAAWVVSRLHRSRLLRGRSLVAGAALWSALVLALYGVLVWLVSTPEFDARAPS